MIIYLYIRKLSWYDFFFDWERNFGICIYEIIDSLVVVE